MEEEFKTHSQDDEKTKDVQSKDDDIRKLAMDNKGKIHESHTQTDKNGVVSVAKNFKLFTILGWISAAFTAFVSPLFVVVGIVFGVLINKMDRGKGNAIIITNIVLAVANIIFGLVLMAMLKKARFY